ncbi:recombinase family protein [Photobacterium carnosum]|uniref:recombinase family protein n=1 Tax=Photobacterium carnosum TaxID=2023717 RepID=UPI001E3D95B2|nr:recombinase family protein [Photobacterium carnosum]MCD9498852.1 helix-turn-helix domain-containing protein [Photobacterium carnosum]
MSLIGFARVSTIGQDLTIQLTKLKEYGCHEEHIFAGKHSGKADTNQLALDELMKFVRKGDTVAVTKIDRFGRSLSQVLQYIDKLTAEGVNLIAIEQGIDTATDDVMSKAMIQMLGMFAEMERNFIVSRTQEGKAMSGNYGGRKPKLSVEQRKDVIRRLEDGESKKKLAEEYQVSRATILNISREETK